MRVRVGEGDSEGVRVRVRVGEGDSEGVRVRVTVRVFSLPSPSSSPSHPRFVDLLRPCFFHLIICSDCRHLEKERDSDILL